MTTEAGPATRTLCETFQATAKAHADDPAVRGPAGEHAMTWGALAERVREAAAGLAALGLGHSDTMACWLRNRPEFHVADTAAMHLGAASFSVYNTYTAEQAAHVVGDAGARIIVTEPAFLEQVLAMQDTAIEHVVLVEGEHERALSWQALLDGGDASFDFDAAWRGVTPDDLLTLIYTSGTTGQPKGVELTHANVAHQIEGLRTHLGFPDEAQAISWLPMAHIAERMCTHYFHMYMGWSATCNPDPAAIAGVMADVHPGFFFSPPRLWEKLRAAVLGQLDEGPKQLLESHIAKVRAGEDFNASAFAPLREKLGLDRVSVAIVGAAPCPPEVIEFYHAIGVPLGELYGMSETTGVISSNPPDAVRIGTVGTLVPNCEVKLGEADEILARGAVVMRGYRNLPDKTTETIDDDGWLHTGDVGSLDDDGYLRITDRIKELIINAAGKNMSPANIEATVKTASDLIGLAVVVGDRRPYNVALLTLEPDVAAAFAKEHGLDADLEALAGHDAVLTEVGAGVERANEKLARVEQVKRWTLLGAEWLPDGDELTPTMKLKRKPIAEKYAAEIDALYE